MERAYPITTCNLDEDHARYSLLDIPYLYRKDIYYYLLSRQHAAVDNDCRVLLPKRLLGRTHMENWVAKQQVPQTQRLSILRVSRLIHEEAVKVLRERISVLLTDLWPGHTVSPLEIKTVIPNSSLETLRSITLTYSIRYGFANESIDGYSQFYYRENIVEFDKPRFKYKESRDLLEIRRRFARQLNNAVVLHEQCVENMPQLQSVSVQYRIQFSDILSLFSLDQVASRHIKTMLKPFRDVPKVYVTGTQPLSTTGRRPVWQAAFEVITKSNSQSTTSPSLTHHHVHFFELPIQVRERIYQWSMAPTDFGSESVDTCGVECFVNYCMALRPDRHDRTMLERPQFFLTSPIQLNGVSFGLRITTLLPFLENSVPIVCDLRPEFRRNVHSAKFITNLLATSRQVQEEVLRVLAASSVFVFDFGQILPWPLSYHRLYANFCHLSLSHGLSLTAEPFPNWDELNSELVAEEFFEQIRTLVRRSPLLCTFVMRFNVDYEIEHPSDPVEIAESGEGLDSLRRQFRESAAAFNFEC